MAAMKRLVFGEGLLRTTLTGEKCITLRKYRAGAHDFTKGEIVCGEFMEGLTVLLRITADTKTKPFAELTNEEAREDGFIDVEHAFEGLKRYYRDLKESHMCAIIRYEVPRIDGVAFVSITNET